MIKKIIACLMLGVILVTSTGCSNKEKKEKTEDTVSSDTEEVKIRPADEVFPLGQKQVDGLEQVLTKYGVADSFKIHKAEQSAPNDYSDEGYVKTIPANGVMKQGETYENFTTAYRITYEAQVGERSLLTMSLEYEIPIDSEFKIEDNPIFKELIQVMYEAKYDFKDFDSCVKKAEESKDRVDVDRDIYHHERFSIAPAIDSKHKTIDYRISLY